MIAAGVLGLIALALGVAYLNRSLTDTRALRLSFMPPENLEYDNGPFDNVIVSPDGQRLAFTARSADGKRQTGCARSIRRKRNRCPALTIPSSPSGHRTAARSASADRGN